MQIFHVRVKYLLCLQLIVLNSNTFSKVPRMCQINHFLIEAGAKCKLLLANISFESKQSTKNPQIMVKGIMMQCI